MFPRLTSSLGLYGFHLAVACELPGTDAQEQDDAGGNEPQHLEAQPHFQQYQQVQSAGGTMGEQGGRQVDGGRSTGWPAAWRAHSHLRPLRVRARLWKAMLAVSSRRIMGVFLSLRTGIHCGAALESGREGLPRTARCEGESHIKIHFVTSLLSPEAFLGSRVWRWLWAATGFGCGLRSVDGTSASAHGFVGQV